jgi:hypothetical protein
MKTLVRRMETLFARMAQAEDPEGEAIPDEMAETTGKEAPRYPAVSAPPDAAEFQAVKSAVGGHGEQAILPDECQFGDNDLCSAEA